MKNLTILLMLSFAFPTLADLDTCMKDALTNSNHFHAVNPPSACAEIIKSSSEKIELNKDGYHLYGMGHMFYVEKDGVIELMAGDQTELESILKFEINVLKNKIILLQENSVSTYRLNFVGNVTPERVYKFGDEGLVTRAKLLEEKNAIAIMRRDSIHIIDANSDSRYDVEALKPKTLFRIQGENSEILNPIDVVISETKNEIYVLDNQRLLVFKTTDEGSQIPAKMISVSDARELKITQGQLMLIKSTGEQIEIKLTN